MTKKEIEQKLEKADIDFDPNASKAELEALLPNEDVEETEETSEEKTDELPEESDSEEAEIEEEEVVEEVSVQENSPTTKGVHIFDRNGNYVRTYQDSTVKNTEYKTALNAAKSICDKNAGWHFKEVK